MCLLHVRAVGMPQLSGATFFMKEIKLSQGKITLVDDEDFDRVNQFKWYAEKKPNSFYARRKDKERKSVYMHRFILNTKNEVDHKNHDGLDNRKTNLRKCSKSENQRNKSPKKNGSSKYLGVHFVKNRNKWRAGIGFPNKFLGEYKTEEEAAIAYNNAARKLHGEFANLNILS